MSPNFNLIIEIEPMVISKVMYWVKKAGSDEVSGLGSVIVDEENNIIRVTDAILLKQENTGGDTELDGQAIAEAMHEHFQGRQPGELKWWWHSHANMGVFWSPTDDTALKQLGVNGWFSATVFNKKQEMKSAFVQGAPVRMLVPDVQTQIIWRSNTEQITQWDEEYKDKVTKKTYIQKGNVMSWQSKGNQSSKGWRERIGGWWRDNQEEEENGTSSLPPKLAEAIEIAADKTETPALETSDPNLLQVTEMYEAGEISDEDYFDYLSEHDDIMHLIDDNGKLEIEKMDLGSSEKEDTK